MVSFTELIPFAAAGLAAGLASYRGFQLMPDSWLLDYDQTEAPAGFAGRRAFPLIPQGLLLIIITGLLYTRVPVVATGWHRAAVMLAVPLLLLILTADWKTRIIPDQLTLALLVPGILKIIGDIANGEVWTAAVGWPLLAGIVAGGSLLLIGFVGQLLLRRDAMGMGDVKLIDVADFVVGWSRLPHLLLISFLTAAVIAIPLLIRNRLAERKSGDDTEAAEKVEMSEAAEISEDAEISETADADSVDDPDAIAFGPFIAIAVLILMLFPEQIDQLVQAYIRLLLR